MLRAAETGNIDAVKRELTGHTDVNSQDKVVFLSLFALYIMWFIAYLMENFYTVKFLSQPGAFWSLSIELPSCYAMCFIVCAFPDVCLIT